MTITSTNGWYTNFTNFVYARRLSHTNVVLLPKAALDTLRHPFSEYRDRRLATVDPALVDTIEVRAEDFFTLRRETNGAWRVTEPLNFAADAEIVNDLVASLGSLVALDFVKDVVTDFSAYGLAKPARQYALRTSTTNAAGAPTNALLVQLELGATQADRAFARRRDEDSVYAVPLGSVLRLPQALFQVRDRHVWNFAASNVVAVHEPHFGGQGFGIKAPAFAISGDETEATAGNATPRFDAELGHAGLLLLIERLKVVAGDGFVMGERAQAEAAERGANQGDVKDARV